MAYENRHTNRFDRDFRSYGMDALQVLRYRASCHCGRASQFTNWFGPWCTQVQSDAIAAPVSILAIHE